MNESINESINELTSDLHSTAARYLKAFNKAFSLLKILRARDALDYLALMEELPFRVLGEGKGGGALSGGKAVLSWYYVGSKWDEIQPEELSKVPFVKETQLLWLERFRDLFAKAEEVRQVWVD